MKLQKLLLRASVERELIWSSALNQDDSKIVNFSALAVASVARNFAWALPKQKGTIK